MSAESIVFRELSPDDRPSWSDVTSAGTFRLKSGATFDAHHHDCDEYWLVFAGRARARVGEEILQIGPGDVVCTPAGTTHDLLAVDGLLEMHWFETATPEGGSVGHLHRTREEADGHLVEALG